MQARKSDYGHIIQWMTRVCALICVLGLGICQFQQVADQSGRGFELATSLSGELKTIQISKGETALENLPEGAQVLTYQSGRLINYSSATLPVPNSNAPTVKQGEFYPYQNGQCVWIFWRKGTLKKVICLPIRDPAFALASFDRGNAIPLPGNFTPQLFLNPLPEKTTNAHGSRALLFGMGALFAWAVLGVRSKASIVEKLVLGVAWLVAAFWAWSFLLTIPLELILNTDLFSRELFSLGSLIPSIGVLMYLAVAGSLLVDAYTRVIKRALKNNPSGLICKVWYYLTFGIIAFSQLLLLKCAETLVFNSTRSPDFARVLDNPLVHTAVFVILASGAMAIASLFRLLQDFEKSNLTSTPQGRSAFISVVLPLFAAGLGFAALVWLLSTSTLVAVALGVFLAGVWLSSRLRPESRTWALAAVGLSLCLFAGVLEWQLSQERRLHAIELARTLYRADDPYAEYVVVDKVGRMAEDATIRQVLLRGRSEEVQLLRNRLRQYYFNGYLERYSISTVALIQLAEDQITPSIDPMDSVVNDLQKNTQDGQLTYRIQIKFNRGVLKGRALQIDLVRRSLANPIELGSESDGEQDYETKAYAYAVYDRDSLLYSSGSSFPYKSSQALPSNEPTLLKVDNQLDVRYRPNLAETEWVIVKLKPSPILSLLGGYSLLFVAVLAIAYARFWRISQVLRPTTYRERIRVAFIRMVVVAMLLFGVVTILYIVNSGISRRTETLLARANHVATFLKEEVALNQQTLSFEDVETQLYRFANYFETDLALFSPTGELIYGTRPELYEAGQLAPLLNTQAKHALFEHGLTAFVQSEPLGQKTYEAAYIPVTYAMGRPALVLQVPNYESSDQQRSELNGFLNNLLNIYVAALLGALILSSLIARRLTAPLDALSKAIAHGSVNVEGFANRRSQPDELNELLEQHQLALAKLQENAELLTRMEKESAWRDMAKQVAHEIKNPLTPMLLSIQRLQRLQREQSPKLLDVFPKTAEILVEQIDSLRRIADEFSSFARMPQTRRIPVDLVKILGDQVALYGENVAISFVNDLSGAIVLSDPDELARAIGNLLRNAIQATQDIFDTKAGLEHARPPKITVSLTEEGSAYLVQVADNGSGIPVAIRPNIFTPNFTTKNSGMGLGLAMVRLTIEQAHGSIRFESEVGEGTTFFITLPAFSAGSNGVDSLDVRNEPRG